MVSGDAPHGMATTSGATGSGRACRAVTGSATRPAGGVPPEHREQLVEVTGVTAIVERAAQRGRVEGAGRGRRGEAVAEVLDQLGGLVGRTDDGDPAERAEVEPEGSGRGAPELDERRERARGPRPRQGRGRRLPHPAGRAGLPRERSRAGRTVPEHLEHVAEVGGERGGSAGRLRGREAGDPAGGVPR